MGQVGNCGQVGSLGVVARPVASALNHLARKVLINAQPEMWILSTFGDLVVGEGAAPSRHADLAFTGAYKTPLHGWCYPPFRRVV